MTGFGDYDTWKLRGPDDDGKICAECGGWLVFGVDPPGWSCESCAAEREIYELIASRQWEGEIVETNQQYLGREYLGDGLYAEFDGYQIRLAASVGTFNTDTVYLEPSVLRALIDYAKRIGMLQ